MAGLINSVSNKEFGKLGSIKSLENLDCSRCLNIADEGLIEFISYDLNMKVINLSGLIKLTDSSIVKLINKFTNLEELDLSCLIQQGISDNCLNGISKLKALTKINISGSRFNDVNGLQSLSNLVSVNVSNIQGVENSFIVFMVTSGVKILRASSCLSLNNNLMETLLSLDKCGLLLLEINRTPKISDVSVAKLMERFSPNLRIIRSTNLVWDQKNIGLKLPLPPIGYEKPILKGMKKAPKKKANDKNPVKMLEKFEIENQPKTLLDYYQRF